MQMPSGGEYANIEALAILHVGRDVAKIARRIHKWEMRLLLPFPFDMIAGRLHRSLSLRGEYIDTVLGPL